MNRTVQYYPSTVLQAAEDFVEASERLAGRIEQNPIVRRDLAVEVRAASLIAGHIVSSIATAKDNLHPVHFTGLFSLSTSYAAVSILRMSRFYFGSSPPCF
jgi:hypothetical protein